MAPLLFLALIAQLVQPRAPAFKPLWVEDVADLAHVLIKAEPPRIQKLRFKTGHQPARTSASSASQAAVGQRAVFGPGCSRRGSRESLNAHQPLVSGSLIDVVQHVLQSKTPRRTTVHNFVFDVSSRRPRPHT